MTRSRLRRSLLTHGVILDAARCHVLRLFLELAGGPKGKRQARDLALMGKLSLHTTPY